MEQTKLVIWDLDETFWRGTLSEGGIEYVHQHHDIIVELARRGIMSSVCSKNARAAVATLLTDQGLWPYIVFPKIAWAPKGEMVRQIIEEAQLRAPNVLFLDDNPQNLAEAAFMCSGLQTAGPEAITGLLALCPGKPDPDLKRLGQYKVLEAKLADRAATGGSNEQFLRQAAIKARVQTKGLAAELDRITDLVERSNQLNFTKRRSTRAELAALIADPTVSAGIVHVRDRYGDSGMVGFYAVRGGMAEHFVFSCRALNMGVEQWVYHAKLGAPVLEIVGKVIGSLGDVEPDWIEDVDVASDAPVQAMPRRRMLLVGGCDLSQVRDFLGGEMAFDAEMNFNGPTGMPVHREHTEILKRSNDPVMLDRYGEVFDRVPFLDRAAYTTRFLTGEHEVYVYSVLMDYTQGLYRYRDTDLVVPYGDYNYDITRRQNWAGERRSYGHNGVDTAFLTWFRDNFTFEGPLSSADFARNLAWLRDQTPGELHIINGAEIDWPGEQGRAARHVEMNLIVDGFAAAYEGVKVVDVRPLIETPADLVDSIRHYQRRVYFEIANELRPALTGKQESEFSRRRRWVAGRTLDAGRSVMRLLPSGLQGHARGLARRMLGR